MRQEERIFEKVVEMLRGGNRGVLVTVVGTTGTTPRGVGSRMLVCTDGIIHGSIGGGCMEQEAVSRAGEILAAGEPCLLTLGPEEPTGAGLRWQGDALLRAPGRGAGLIIVGNGHVGGNWSAWLGSPAGRSGSLMTVLIGLKGRHYRPAGQEETRRLAAPCNKKGVDIRSPGPEDRRPRPRQKSPSVVYGAAYRGAAGKVIPPCARREKGKSSAARHMHALVTGRIAGFHRLAALAYLTPRHDHAQLRHCWTFTKAPVFLDGCR